MNDDSWMESLTPAQARVVGAVRTQVPAAMTALFLTGSLARGTADQFSDVDFIAIVAPSRMREALRQWLTLAGALFTPVMQKIAEQPQTIVNIVDPQWTRIDLVLHPADRPFGRAQDACLPIHDPEGIWSGLAPSSPGSSTDARTVERIVIEFLRILGLLTVVIGRGEWAVGVTGAGLLRQQLVALMIEEGRKGAPEGALHLNRLLDPEQRVALETLPPLSADAASIVALHLACARLFLPRAKALAQRVGMEWPTSFEAATMQALERAGLSDQAFQE